MDQFRQVGKVAGSLKAVMVLKHEIPINQRQCCLLFDLYMLAFETISEEIRQHLRLEERNTKWKALEEPLKELHKVFKDGEDYIRYCLDIKDWWGKAISLHLNRDCVEYHIHNLLCCFSVVIEAIEAAAEISVSDPEDMQKRRSVLTRKYETTDCNDPNFFQWMYGKQYLVSKDICNQIDSAIKEDQWLLAEKIREKKGTGMITSSFLSKQEQKLGDMLLKKLDGSGSENVKLLPNSILVGASDYLVKRRLGLGEGRMKEVQWLGENFAVRTFFGEVEPLNDEISLILSLSHPNILQHLCGFYDEEKRECNLVMELMNKSLKTYIKENTGQRKSLPFPTLPAAVDIMLQIARGMEYLHSKKVYHGELNPSNVLLRSRTSSSKETFLQAKVTGFGLSSIKSYARSPIAKGEDPVIWYAPEVLAEQEQFGQKRNSMKYSEKADVYSFGMLCFELLTGKVPFEDSHLQGDKMARNIRAGERPLFPHPSPKYLANLTKKCWHPNQSLRPSFTSITRILRYIKKNLIINPDHGDPESPPPLVDYCDIETGYLKKFPVEETNILTPTTQVPFQLFTYSLIQKEKISGSFKDKIWYSFNEETLAHRPASICGHEHLAAMDDLFLVPSDRRSVSSEIIERKYAGASMDQRSVISEIPQMRSLTFDRRSVGSVSPGRKFDRRSFSAVTPERLVSCTQIVDKSMPSASSKKFKFPETSDKEIFSAAEIKTINSKTSEMKVAAISTTDHKKTHSELEEKESKPDPQVSYETPEKKTSRRKFIHKKKLSEIPEQNICYAAATSNQKPASTKTSCKKYDPSTTPNNSVKRSTSHKKLREAITMNGSEVSKDNSPRNSPARILRMSSAPAASPPRILRMSSAPAASPPRTFKASPLPKFSSSVSKEYLLSPMSSPLNPVCTRCSKGNKESTVPPGASPHRVK